jgi:hypothetical protein
MDAGERFVSAIEMGWRGSLSGNAAFEESRFGRPILWWVQVWRSSGSRLRLSGSAFGAAWTQG